MEPPNLIPPMALEKIDIEKFNSLQATDPDIQKLKLTSVESLDEEKATCFYVRSGVLWRRWRPSQARPHDGMWDSHQRHVGKDSLLLSTQPPFQDI